MELLLWGGVFILSLAALVKASDWFIGGAETIGKALGVPSFIIGVTIVAMGTSLPELASSIAAVYFGNSEIVVGNAIGSNITNILLVLGLVAVVGKQFEIKHDIMYIDIPMLIASSLLLWFVIYDLDVTLFDALVLVVGLVIFLIYTIKGNDKADENIEREAISLKTYAIVAASGVLIYFSATYTVEAIGELSGLIGINTEIIALSLVALGTSLPEVIVSVSATRKGNPEIALGNILGSNVFNTFAVVGLPAFLGDINIPDSILTFSLPMMMAVTLLFAIMCISKRISQWEGYMLLLFYIVFIGGLFKGVSL